MRVTDAVCLPWQIDAGRGVSSCVVNGYQVSMVRTVSAPRDTLAINNHQLGLISVSLKHPAVWWQAKLESIQPSSVVTCQGGPRRQNDAIASLSCFGPLGLPANGAQISKFAASTSNPAQ